MAAITTSPAAMLATVRLLQLASPALPIGAYAYSEGLEAAVESGRIADEADTAAWIGGLLEHAFARLDLPLFGGLHRAFEGGDRAAAVALSARLVASRETAELRAADRHLGQALARLLADLGVEAAAGWVRRPERTHAALVALGCVHFRVDAPSGACALAFGWAENLVGAALKLVPLGQTAGQRVLLGIGARIPGVCAAALALDPARDAGEIGAAATGLALASCAHETQATRLFRS